MVAGSSAAGFFVFAFRHASLLVKIACCAVIILINVFRFLFFLLLFMLAINASPRCCRMRDGYFCAGPPGLNLLLPPERGCWAVKYHEDHIDFVAEPAPLAAGMH